MVQAQTKPRKRRHLRQALRLIAIGYLAILAIVIFAHVGDRLILLENHRAIDPGGARQIVIPLESGDVETWVARSPAAVTAEPDAFILMFVGQGDRADRWVWKTAQGWGQRRIEVWGMNYPGSGGSSGPNQLSRVAPAALATYDYMASIAHGRPILVQGASLGTVPALCVAARRPIAALTLHNPVPLRQLVLGRQGWWNLWLLAIPVALQIPADLDSVANAAKTTAPAVFIVSDHDEVVPPAYHDLVVNAYGGTNRIVTVRGALHNSGIDASAQVELGSDIDWLWSQVVPSQVNVGTSWPATDHPYINTLH